MTSQFTCDLCLHTKFKKCDKFTQRLGIDPNRSFIVKCLKCGLVSLFPTPDDQALSQIYSGYAAKGNRVEVEQFRVNNIYPRKMKILQKYVPNKAKILDIGAGLGGFVSVAQKKGFQVTGVELEKGQVNLAKEVFQVELINESFEAFSEHDSQKYDVVHLHHVLEHLRNPRTILEKIRTKLNKNGILLLEVPNEFFYLSQEIKILLKKKKPNISYEPYHHLYFFSPVTFHKLISASGYSILELNEPGKHQPGLKLNVNRILSSLLHMGISNRIEVVARPIL
ncbi:class I SAM-dependent methyltransferase [candidate division KSB1 bacterium]|nr:class I SAM-dependent methyltransferase [candidate division KSB1 bacterium]